MYINLKMRKLYIYFQIYIFQYNKIEIMISKTRLGTYLYK